MAIIRTSTFGLDIPGEFRVEALLKIFGPTGTIGHTDDYAVHNLQKRGREYAGTFPRVLLNWRGGVLQIIWKVSYNIGNIFGPKGSGYGNILHSWSIAPQISSHLIPPSQLPAQGTNRPRPVLTYVVRPAQSLTTYSHSDFEVVLDSSYQDRVTGGSSGEIRSGLSVRAGTSTRSSATVTIQSGALSVTHPVSDSVISEGGSFSCTVVAPYSGGTY